MFTAGDVLMTHGSGAISWAIRFLDRSEVNHVAIVVDGSTLAEAGGHGLQRGPIQRSIDGNRFVHQRRSSVTDTGPVVAVANQYVDGRVPYAYQQIALLGVLCATRAIPLPRIARRFVRAALEGAADVINSKLDRDGTGLMICSEFVYRCYAEAAPPHALITSLADIAAAGGSTYTFLDDWAQEHEALLVAEAQAGVAAPAGAGGGDTELTEVEGAIGEYAASVVGLDDEAGLIAAEYAPQAAAAAVLPEPTDVELARSMVRLSGSLERAMSTDLAMPAGIGTDIGFGALRGLLETRVNPNFVTPGDLFRSGSLTHVDTHRR